MAISRRARSGQRRASRAGCSLGEEFLDYLGFFHAGEALIEALVFHGEPFMIVAEEVENGGVEIADVEGVLYDVVAEVVGLSEDGPPRVPPPAIHIVKQRGWWSRP